MPVVSTDIKLKKSANHPTDDASTAGGAISATEITNSSIGEWMPSMTAQESGTLDTNAEQQYQEAYIHNTHGTDSWGLGGIYMDNLYTDPASAGVAKFVSTSASDDATKKIRRYGEVGGVLDTEDIVLNGITEVSGIKSWTRVFRDVVLQTSNDAVTTATGRITSKVGTEEIGAIPAGESYGTSEYDFAAPTTIGDTATFTNRKTDPGGLTWRRPNTPATRLYVRDNSADATLLAGEKQAIYCRQTLQPGIPPVQALKRCLKLYGEAI